MSAARWIGALFDRRGLAVALVLAVTALAGWMARGVGVDNAVEIWFLDDDPALIAYQDFQQTFGNDEVVVLAVTDPDGLLDAQGMATVRALGDQALAVEGIAEVRSLATILDVSATPESLDLHPLVPDDLDLLPADFRDHVLADPMLVDQLVSADGTTALVLARMDAADDIDARRDGILAELEAATADVPHRSAGIGVIYAALNKLATVDSAVFIGGSYVVIFLLLLVLFRKLSPVLVSLVVVGVGAVWLMGAFGAGDRDINMVTMVLPTLVVIIGISDCVHVLNHAAALPQGGTRRERVVQAVSFMFWPCLFNTLTTAVGFLALMTAPMAVVRDLGLYAAIGMGIAFVLAIVGCTVALASPRAEPKLPDDSLLLRAVQAATEVGLRYPTQVLVITGLLGLTSALGIARLEVDTYSIDFLYDSHPVKQDSAAIEAEFGPYMPLEVVVQADEGVLTPEILGAVWAWQDAAVDQVDTLGWSRSAADVVARMQQVLTDGRPESAGIPSSEAAIAQALLIYDTEPESDLDSLVAAGDTQLRVTFGMDMMSARGMEETLEQTLALAELPPGTSVQPSGYLPLYVRMMDYIVRSQITSFGLAFVIVFTLLSVLFKSVRVAALSVPANLVPVLFVLGVMGLVGIRLDVATVTIAAIVLGLVVDDTVQFLYRYRAEFRRLEDHEAAVRETSRTVGRSLATTTLVLALGFSVLGLADVKSVAYFGVLIALSMVFALIMDLVVMPALIVTVRPRL
jgi:predicted RND superfamily exporter protein